MTKPYVERDYDAPPRVDDDYLGKFRADHPVTSLAAAATIPKVGSKRRKVYDHLVAQGVHGATDDEIQVALDMNPSTQRPRRVELVDAGFVVASDLVRRTRGGKMATVWRIA